MSKAERAFRLLQRELVQKAVWDAVASGSGKLGDIIKNAIHKGDAMLVQTAGGIYEDEQGNLVDINGKVLVKKEDRQRCEVYSRVVGYLRPESSWNKGKRAEFKDRKVFVNKIEGGDPLPERES